MANLGSVFLGDSKRHRLLSSSSTPPSSPPPVSTPAMSILSALPSPQSPLHTEALNNFSSDSIEPFTHIQALGLEKVSKEPPPSIDPITSLELRLRLLESLIVGLDPDEKGKLELKNDTLVKSAENVKRTVDKYVEGNDTLKRFIAHCAYDLEHRLERH